MLHGKALLKCYLKEEARPNVLEKVLLPSSPSMKKSGFVDPSGLGLTEAEVMRLRLGRVEPITYELQTTYNR